jgi:hypothetical protein
MKRIQKEKMPVALMKALLIQIRRIRIEATTRKPPVASQDAPRDDLRP